MNNRRSTGFTLVELMIAMLVFSLLSTFAFRAVSLLGTSNEQIAYEQRTLGSIQKGLVFWERDVRTAMALSSPSNEDVGYSDDAEEAQLLLALTTVASKGAGGEAEGGVRTISYLLDKEAIYREEVSSGAISKLLLINQVGSASVEVVKNSGLADEVGAQPSGSVDLVFDHKEHGQIQRTLYLALAGADIGLNTLPLDGDSGGTSAGGAPSSASNTDATSGGSNGGGTAGTSTGSGGASTTTPPPVDPLGGESFW